MDTAFDLLSNSRRRFTLYYLSRTEGEVPLNEVAARVAAWENDTEVDELSDSQQKRTYVSLYQTHFPKLTEVGIIRFDRDRSVVELTDKADELADYLPGDAGPAHPWPVYYLALAIGAAVVQALVLFDVAATGAILDAAIGIVAIVGVGVLAAIHRVVERRATAPNFSRLKRE